MMQEIGCNIRDARRMKTNFPHPANKEPVAASLDLCHTLKLLRNALVTKGCFIDQNGHIVPWAYTEKLHKLQEEEGVRFANKLHQAHVHWEWQAMKVRLAAQVKIESTATALAECRVMASFTNSQPTETFLRHVINILNVLNSRNMHQRGWKQPLNEANFKDVEELFDSMTQYLSSLKESQSKQN